MEAVAYHGGTPYIAFRANTTGRDGGLYAKMFHYYSFNRDDFLDHYHKRSNVETTFCDGQGEVRGQPAVQDGHRDGQRGAARCSATTCAS